MGLFGPSRAYIKKEYLRLLAKLPQLSLAMDPKTRNKILKDIQNLKDDVTEYLRKNIISPKEVDEMFIIIRKCNEALKKAA